MNKVKMVLLQSGKDYLKILVDCRQDVNSFIPEFEVRDLENLLSQLASLIEKNLHLTCNVISLDPIVENQETGYYAAFISKQKEGEEPDTTPFTWVHRREAERLFTNKNLDKIMTQTYEWIRQGNYSIEFLSNNLDKMR